MAASADPSPGPRVLRWHRIIVQSTTGIVRCGHWWSDGAFSHLPDTAFRSNMLVRFQHSDAAGDNGLVRIEHPPDPETGETCTVFGSVDVVRCQIVHQEGQPSDH